ncbi:MAG: translation initiation factor IF-2 [Verrucomicrobia bacterium]|nr:translation initiation factor IF-2 [Verrucomicrobiota bacterium]
MKAKLSKKKSGDEKELATPEVVAEPKAAKTPSTAKAKAASSKVEQAAPQAQQQAQPEVPEQKPAKPVVQQEPQPERKPHVEEIVETKPITSWDDVAAMRTGSKPEPAPQPPKREQPSVEVSPREEFRQPPVEAGRQEHQERRSFSGFQRRDDTRREDTRRDDSRPSGFQPRRDDTRPSGFQPRRDDSRPSGFQPRRDDGRPSGFQPRRDDSRPSGFQPRRDDGRPSGFQPRRDDSRPSGFQPRRDDGRPSGFQPRREDGRPSGFQPRGGPGGPSRPPFGSRPTEDARRMAPFTKAPMGGPSGKSEGVGERKPQEKKSFTTDAESESLRRSRAKAKDAQSPKPGKKGDGKDADVRLRHGFRATEDDDQVWRKRRPTKQFRAVQEQEVVRPTKISVRLPISVKDLAVEMKLKASELISKLFLQGMVVTLNDVLDDDTVVQLLGDAFGCEIAIDTKEEERIRITGKSIKEEILSQAEDACIKRPPVIAFMGHVDHGKTSLIDYIRKSNVAAHEVGAITQHIGAFTCHTSHGDITVLDTPGHEAFSEMRGRGAEITDIVVLVVAGDEGMKEQTYEALAQAQAANATIVVAITKSDKPNFNAETVYRELADKNLLPEAWGGQTITVNCSSVTGQGVQELLEMLALQADVLELKANPDFRARGTVIESEVFKGLGPVATVLVQNGTLQHGDCLVFGYHWARIKSMRDEKGKELQKAGPSTPVLINGLSGLPESGEEFIVVKNEKEARDISQVRQEGKRLSGFQMKKRLSVEGMMEKAADSIVKKVLTLIIRGDVQGSVEALKNAIEKIESKKVEVNIISSGVSEISESDVQLAMASKAVILGFHVGVESHVEPKIKELGIQVRLHDIIYHATDDVKVLMKSLLEKISQEIEKGKAEIKATFKSSQLGLIAGCQVIEGSIARNSQVRVLREGKAIWKGSISSLKRNKEDVREVQKGMECGILLQGFSDIQQGDIIEAFEVTYLTQDL